MWTIAVILIVTRFCLGLPVNSSSVIESGIRFSGVHYLEERGDFAVVEKAQYEDLNYFCHRGNEPSLVKFWSSASFKLDITSQDYQVYIGPNVTVVSYLHDQSESAWFYSQLPWKTKEFKFSPFQDTCIGVKTSHNYKMLIQMKSINYIMLIITVIGVVTFFMAKRLCRNQFFHFATGISAGILLSVLVLTYLLQRKLRVQWFSWITLLYSLSLYFITSTWYNIKDYMSDAYFHWIVGYILCSGLLSFAIIYRLGPPSNSRTVNLIQWTMQGVSLICVVMSSYHQVASLSFALLLLTWSTVPRKVKYSAATQFRKTFFRPKVKLLTEEEYIAQRNENTRKAMEELRLFCRSPESKPWQTVTKLTSPKRFAEFIEGSPHITETEIMEYSHWDSVETDDEDSRSNLTDDGEDDELGNRSFDGQADL